MMVVDASAVVDLLLGTGSDAGDRLAAALRAREAVCAPHLLDAEVGQVIRRYTLCGEVTAAQAGQMIREALGHVPGCRARVEVAATMPLQR